MYLHGAGQAHVVLAQQQQIGLPVVQHMGACCCLCHVQDVRCAQY